MRAEFYKMAAKDPIHANLVMQTLERRIDRDPIFKIWQFFILTALSLLLPLFSGFLGMLALLMIPIPSPCEVVVVPADIDADLVYAYETIDRFTS